jgi:hypothetical protein
MRAAIILVVLISMASVSMAEDTTTVYDKDWKTAGFVRNGIIYNSAYEKEGYITKDGRLLDKNYERKGEIKPAQEKKGKR